MQIMQQLMRLAGYSKVVPIDKSPDQTKTADLNTLDGEQTTGAKEKGLRTTPENAVKYLYRRMWVDTELRATIQDIRNMDKLDGRVKKIHGRMARTAIKGGLRIETNSSNKKLISQFKAFSNRLKLHRREKLESDCRGLVMEGNLPMQWVLSPDNRVVAGIRMPTETIVPRVGKNGAFIDPAVAYEQMDLTNGLSIAQFALWQLSLVRMSPDNFDDMGCLGRPYLDAQREVWRKLRMTEEDLVIRRRTRAPQRLSHNLEAVDQAGFDTYKSEVENSKDQITTDFYIKGKGQVVAVGGDGNLAQILDVVHLLDTFYAGAPAPKGLFGYVGDLNRDILEDLKQDYFDEIDSLQDTLAYTYEMGFRLDLLLQGINPDEEWFQVIFTERRTDTPNQRADLALKYQALGMSRETVIETTGADPADEKERLINEAEDNDPYPEPFPEEASGGNKNNVSITPGNRRKGESATDISTRR